ncbi:MAG: tRNA (adenosine(37)-N6)-dimethylallyltransferase MiaA [Pseudomonadota bacterium]
MRPAILIHGPTASGKTSVAIELAKTLDGEIINADSMQVYRDLKVLSARPDPSEMQDVTHHMFGHVDAATRYSTGLWLEDATQTIADVQRRGRLPIIAGGTGLYLLALTEGLSEIPPVPEDIRADVRYILQDQGIAGLYARLQAADPAMAADLSPNDRQRVSRAYEVWLATGKSIRDFQGSRSRPVLAPGEWLGVALTPPRTRLYNRIDRRFETMMMHGGMEEARALVGRGLDPELPAMKASGLPWLAAFIRGEMTAETAADHAKRDTRRYAKRQFTWISRQFPFWPRIPALSDAARKKVIFALYREIDPG